MDEKGPVPERDVQDNLVERVAGILETLEARPSWDEYFMATALLIAARSSCGRLHVGCVLVSGGDRRNRILAAGYNGFLPGAPHTSRVRDGHEQVTVHAEQNAVVDAARRGASIEGAVAYISHFPCINCTKVLAAAGVSAIRYHFDYSNDPLVLELLAEANIPITRF
jgi:dCMP deaminase